MTATRHPPADGKAAPVGYFELSTDHLPPKQRLEFWYESTGRRMDCRRGGDPSKEVKARVRGLVRNDVEFLDYTSESFLMTRDRAMCGRDGRDEVSIGLVMSHKTGAIQNDNELSLQQGELYVIDFGRPVSSVIPNHHELAVALPRRVVAQAMGRDLDTLGGQRLSTSGIGGLLASNMQALAREARFLTPTQQQIALQAIADLALATLQASALGRNSDLAPHTTGLYAAACQMIRQHCTDFSFDVDRLATMMCCSRASLYRMFRDQNRSVAAEIWDARLQCAHNMLMSKRYSKLTIAEIALRAGFLDQSTFSKMFKQRYGMSPRDLR
jgi:AraC-like DNA-binding protein